MPNSLRTLIQHGLLGGMSAFLVAAAGDATAQPVTWVGGDGAWSVASNWLGANVPDTPSESAVVANGSTATVNGSFGIGGLTVGSGDTVAIAPTSALGLSSDSSNDGSISINASHLRLDGSVSLTGAGEIVFLEGGNFFTSRLGNDFSSLGFALTNGPAHTIRSLGAARLGLLGTRINNQGLITASGSAGYLYVDAANSLGGLVNTGVVRATTQGVVELRGLVDSTGGTIEGIEGGRIVLANGSVVSGGQLVGSIDAIAGSEFRDLQVDGTLAISGTTYAAGTVVNNGSIVIGQSGNGFLTTKGTTTFSGMGEVLFDGGPGLLNNQFGSQADGGIIVNDVGHTVRAVSDARFGQSMAVLVNHGTIIAEGPLGNMEIDPKPTATTPLTNTGLISAQSGGRIFLNTLVDSSAGRLEAIGAGSRITRNASPSRAVIIGDVRAIDGGSVEVFTSTGGDQDLSGNAYELEFTGMSYTDIFAEGTNGELPGAGASEPGHLRSNQFSDNSGVFRIADGLNFTSIAINNPGGGNTGTIIAGAGSTFAMGFYGLNSDICTTNCTGGGPTVGAVYPFVSTGTLAGAGVIANANAPGMGGLTPVSGPFFPNPVLDADIFSDGVISPGDDLGAIGTLTLVGDEIEFGENNVVQIDVGPSGSDRLVLVTGSAPVALAGELRIEFLPGFSASAGVTLDVLSAANGFTGDFDTLTLPELAGGLEWLVDQQGASLSITTVLAGDFNDDGQVDAADYTLWRDNVGAPAGTLVNDPNVGAAIGQPQYDSWSNNYGRSLSAGVTAVPEPSAAGLAIALIVASGLPSKRRQATRPRG